MCNSYMWPVRQKVHPFVSFCFLDGGRNEKLLLKQPLTLLLSSTIIFLSKIHWGKKKDE